MDAASEELERIKQRRYQAALRTLGELEAPQLEEVLIGAETELAKREPEVDGNLLLRLTDISDKIDEREKTWGKVGGLSTGLPSLDARIGGLKGGELILIGGKPKNGKTALAQNIAVNVSREHPVLFITLELLAEETGVRVKHINHGQLTNNFIVQAQHRLDYRKIRPLFEQAKEEGVKLVVLDYLQFLGRGMTNEEVAKMSKEMKTLALEFEVPFIVIVSLRKGDTKFNTKWTDIELDDISGTSSIGYDADTIMMTSRKDDQDKKDADHLWVKVVAVRSMQDSDELLWYDWDRTRVTEPKVPLSIIKDKNIPDGDISDKGELRLAYKD